MLSKVKRLDKYKLFRMVLKVNSFFDTHTRKMSENYDEITRLLDPTQKKSENNIITNSKIKFLKTLTPFMFLQASVGICASLQVNEMLFIIHSLRCWILIFYKYILGHILPGGGGEEGSLGSRIRSRLRNYSSVAVHFW